jgi:hypothetical protein
MLVRGTTPSRFHARTGAAHAHVCATVCAPFDWRRLAPTSAALSLSHSVAMLSVRVWYWGVRARRLCMSWCGFVTTSWRASPYRPTREPAVRGERPASIACPSSHFHHLLRLFSTALAAAIEAHTPRGRMGCTPHTCTQQQPLIVHIESVQGKTTHTSPGSRRWWWWCCCCWQRASSCTRTEWEGLRE